MILKHVQVSNTRYFTNVRNLCIDKTVILDKEMLETILEVEQTTCDNETEFAFYFNESEINYMLKPIVKVLYFESNDGTKKLITFDSVYYMNDNGKTVETI